MPRAWSKFTKEQVLEAITDSYGIVSQVMRNLQKCTHEHCAWNTADSYINHWEETRQAFEDEEERSLDFTVTQMIGLIRAGFWPAMRFHLATKGKRRGYVERQELANADGDAFKIRMVWDDDTNSDVAGLARRPEAGVG